MGETLVVRAYRSVVGHHACESGEELVVVSAGLDITVCHFSSWLDESSSYFEAHESMTTVFKWHCVKFPLVMEDRR